MATLAELQTAFVQADDAGNTEDAQAFADEIFRMQSQPQSFNEEIYRKRNPKVNDPTETMSAPQKVLAGAGKAYMDIGRGVKQRLGFMSPQEVDEIKRLDQPLMQTKAGIGGNVLGNLVAFSPTMFIPGVNSLAGSTALGAGIGALQPTGTRENVYQNIGTGAAFGAAGNLIPRAAARIVNPKAAQRVTQSVGQLTPGQALGQPFKAIEEKATVMPIAGGFIAKSQRESVKSFNKGVLNKVLEPLGETTNAIGHEGIKDVHQKISNAYNTVLPKLNIQADKPFVDQLNTVRTMAAQSFPETQLDQLNRILDQKVLGGFTKAGKMSGEQMKIVDSQLGKLASNYSRSENYDVSQLGDAIRETQAALRDMVTRANPQHAQELKKANDAFAQFIRVERAASSLGAKEGVFTPAQLLNAAKASEKSLRHGAFAEGGALLQGIAEQAEKTIGSKFPTSGTTERMLQVAAVPGYIMQPGALAADLGVAGAYGVPQIRNALTAMVGKRPAIAPEVANFLRLTSPTMGKVGALGSAAYLSQE